MTPGEILETFSHIVRSAQTPAWSDGHSEGSSALGRLKQTATAVARIVPSDVRHGPVFSAMHSSRIMPVMSDDRKARRQAIVAGGYWTAVIPATGMLEAPGRRALSSRLASSVRPALR